jgi:murein DD-endopeptidase MepM/ murein hydrolase activator NlpD
LALALAGGAVVAGPASPAKAITASGVGTYCSVTWPSGGWAFTSSTSSTGDPCASAVRGAASGYTIQRRGLYSASGINNVVARCNSSQSWVVLYKGAGSGPLTAAFNAAKNGSQSSCIFTVAPLNLPVFDAPFKSPTGYDHWSGFDFARAPYGSLKPSDFGQSGSTAAGIVDWLGRARTNYINDHDAIDYMMNRNNKVYAAADGKVIMARDYKSTCTNSDSIYQKEVAIEHVVYAPNTKYYEKFVTYYAHFSSYSVKTNDVVTKGQQIGLSGNTGCSNPAHLHFAVFRTTNTASHLSETLLFNTATSGANPHNNGRPYLTDPYGFQAPKGFDPWAWKAYPQGALSINLWNSGQAPSRSSW